MANKYVALLLVVCLIGVATVEAQRNETTCFNNCIEYECPEHPSKFCKFICHYGCSIGLTNTNKVGVRAKAPESSWAEAPQFSRKVQV
ncbi:hypothetical protein PHAVU_001G126900 [Phaseolus vulgaris]|uniref:Uncharacterized protein n=1 Tax=Phaseolus vulgaris TaxID=3885 RepID=V7CXM1_PHAVU|nr:hypothetical protein PHAVU_001G126900g [Phaseolus vulgaris]ESW34128.1 hypothetical protein PHAVU_001G126900g [Phaseolus vulgaris]